MPVQVALNRASREDILSRRAPMPCDMDMCCYDSLSHACEVLGYELRDGYSNLGRNICGMRSEHMILVWRNDGKPLSCGTDFFYMPWEGSAVLNDRNIRDLVERMISEINGRTEERA